MKLSIIIPTYNSNENLIRLLQILQQQIIDDVEVIVIDDHSDRPLKLDFPNWLKFIELDKNSGGASVPRNIGLDTARGEYIAFIDADDLISNDYIETILNKTKEEWDYCYISWKGQSNTVTIEDKPPNWNCCVWNCVYKKELIGDEKFKPELKMAEDYDFNKRVRKGKKANITKILYYYNETTPNSLTKQGVMYNDKYKRSDINAI
jgi:glycosyltransferase involved in cell wall biosynthesis